MNPLSRLVKPDPQPAWVLLAGILAIFGIVAYRKGFRIVTGVCILIAIILIVRFVRGLLIDLQVNQRGIRTDARVARVEQLQDKKEKSLFWRVTFTFTDPTGVSHELWFDEGDEETARRYEKPGAVAKIRYHPDFPEQFRVLE